MPLENRVSNKETVLEVYKKVLAQVNFWRDRSKKLREPFGSESEESRVAEALATELFTVCAHLEMTEEVNRDQNHNQHSFCPRNTDRRNCRA